MPWSSSPCGDAFACLMSVCASLTPDDTVSPIATGEPFFLPFIQYSWTSKPQRPVVDRLGYCNPCVRYGTSPNVSGRSFNFLEHRRTDLRTERSELLGCMDDCRRPQPSSISPLEALASVGDTSVVLLPRRRPLTIPLQVESTASTTAPAGIWGNPRVLN